MLGYEYVARQLKAIGVTHVFGLMSDDTLLLIATLDSIGITYVSARHENNAIAMAEGYASATSGLGVAIIGRGPALANGMHGAAYTAKTGSQVLILYGDPPAKPAPGSWGPDEKSIDAHALLSAAGLKVFRAITTDSLPEVFVDATKVALGGNPAALLMPVDVQRAKFVSDVSILDQIAPPSLPQFSVRKSALDAAVEQINKSKRPLIVAGLGAHKTGAKQAIESLAERIGALIVTTAKAKDMFRGSPYNVGVIGSFSLSIARRVAERADCVIAFGASLNRRSTSSGSALPSTAPLIHIDTNRSAIGRWIAADVAIAADARIAAEAILAAVVEKDVDDKPFHSNVALNEIASFQPQSEFSASHTSHTVDPRSLAIALDRLLPERRSVVYDTGNFIGVLPYVSVIGPSDVKLSADFASIGMGMGVALGTSIARPQTVTVLFVGDGGFLMAMGDIETAARQNLPFIIVLMNDCAYGAEMHFLKMCGMAPASAIFPDVDFASVAEPFGFEAHTIRSLDDLERLRDMLREPSGPVFLDCKINSAVQAPFLAEPRVALDFGSRTVS